MIGWRSAFFVGLFAVLAVRGYAFAEGDTIDLDAEIAELNDYTPYVRPPSGSAAAIALGKELFFDPRLSRNGAMSCSTCHQPSFYWGDGRARAVGLNGKELGRNTPSLLTARYFRSLFWDGRADSLEQAAVIAISNPEEMNEDPKRLVVRLRAIPGYAREFTVVFGTAGATVDDVAGALAAFVGSIQGPEDSPFDQFLKDRTGLPPAARRGYTVFAGKASCKTCHNSRDFTNETFRNIGLKPRAPADIGLYLVSPEPGNWGAFRTPSLRDVELTAPYMHDGSLATLKDVIEFYDRGGDANVNRDKLMRPLHLTAAEKSDLLAFLRSLTGSVKHVDVPLLPTSDEGSPRR
jgi:cytochrome c peroxidase